MVRAEVTVNVAKRPSALRVWLQTAENEHIIRPDETLMIDTMVDVFAELTDAVDGSFLSGRNVWYEIRRNGEVYHERETLGEVIPGRVYGARNRLRELGTYTFIVEFEGDEYYEGCTSTKGVGVPGEEPPPTPGLGLLALLFIGLLALAPKEEA